MTLLSYHSSNLSLIVLETMQLLVLIRSHISVAVTSYRLKFRKFAKILHKPSSLGHVRSSQEQNLMELKQQSRRYTDKCNCFTHAALQKKSLT